MENFFVQWWRVVRVTDREDNDFCKYPVLLENTCYAYGLHLEFYDANCKVFSWQIVHDCGKYVTWDNYTTSKVEQILEATVHITVKTRNSVYYFEKIDPPVLPHETYQEDYLEECGMPSDENESELCVAPTMFGKLLLLRSEQQKLHLYNDVGQIRRALGSNRRYKIRTDYSIVDLIKDSDDTDNNIQVISNWLTARAVAFREAKNKADEKELYRTFFIYTLQMLVKGSVNSDGIDDVIKMAEVLQEDPCLYVGTFENCMADTDHKDMLLDVQDWIGTELIIPPDFEIYVIAAVAAFVGTLPDPLTVEVNNDEQIA